jgi:hypothetical protein
MPSLGSQVPGMAPNHVKRNILVASVYIIVLLWLLNMLL